MKNDLPPTPLGRSLEMTLRAWTEYYQGNVVTKQVHYRGVHKTAGPAVLF